VDKTAPINLMDHDKRKDAFGAMLDDDLSKLSPDLKAAAVSQSLPQIFPVLEKVESLDQLDVIANGNDDKTAEAANALLDHSRNLLANALKSMWSRVSDIENHANIVTNTPNTLLVNGQYVTENISRKNGLSDANRTELKNDIATCSKIHDAAEVFIPMAKTDKDWPAILSDADRVAGRASDILNADYGQTTSQENPGGYNSGSYTGQPLGGTGIPTTPVTPPKPPKPTTPTTPKTGSGN
jgi:hypothetical protein